MQNELIVYGDPARVRHHHGAAGGGVFDGDPCENLASTGAVMANIVIRNIDPDMLEKLKKRATRNNRTLQGELREILQRATAFDIDFRKASAEIRRKIALHNRKQSDSTKLIAADRRR